MTLNFLNDKIKDISLNSEKVYSESNAGPPFTCTCIVDEIETRGVGTVAFRYLYKKKNFPITR